jgi:hypothetical protein
VISARLRRADLAQVSGKDDGVACIGVGDIDGPASAVGRAFYGSAPDRAAYEHRVTGPVELASRAGAAVLEHLGERVFRHGRLSDRARVRQVANRRPAL